MEGGGMKAKPCRNIHLKHPASTYLYHQFPNVYNTGLNWWSRL